MSEPTAEPAWLPHQNFSLGRVHAWERRTYQLPVPAEEEGRWCWIEEDVILCYRRNEGGDMNSADSNSLPIDAAKARELFDRYMSEDNLADFMDALGSSHNHNRDGDEA